METAVVTGGAGLYGTAWGQPQPLNEELRGFAMSVALNAAACYLKLGAAAASCTHDGEAEFGDDGLASSDMCRWRCSAVCRCERVVRLDPTNVKARFRHAQALASGGRLVDARLDLEVAPLSKTHRRTLVHLVNTSAHSAAPRPTSCMTLFMSSVQFMPLHQPNCSMPFRASCLNVSLHEQNNTFNVT